MFQYLPSNGDRSEMSVNGPRPRVLIPSDQRDWVLHFAEAYRRLGFDVTTGTYNFELESSSPDILHLLWPEELTGWKIPTQRQIDAILGRLARWRERTRVIFTHSNLYPHGHYRNRQFHQLYSLFFEHAEVIHHFSHTSTRLVSEEYPTVTGRNHIVRVGWNYDFSLANSPRDRVTSRQSFGFADSDMVYLVFGSLRFWDEVELLRRAFRLAKVPGKRLLLAARYTEGGNAIRQRWRRLVYRHWKKSVGPLASDEYISDEDVCRFFDAADAVVVVRESTLSTGIPHLAMTCGRMVIGPNAGGVPEFVADAGNILYEPSSPHDLARAMECAAQIDCEQVGRRNREIAEQRDWVTIVRACLDALPQADDSCATNRLPGNAPQAPTVPKRQTSA
jgi:glycosyltransferase involved in cell wall biosynthesis